MGSNIPSILIVGGGPAGSACGILLARAGFHVSIFEKASFPRDKICGDCINPRNWTYFELLGVADELRSRELHEINSFRVSNASGTMINCCLPRHKTRPFFSFSRRELDSILLRKAHNDGAVVHEKTAVREIYWQNGWRIGVERAGSLQGFSGDILIGADGRNSVVAKKVSRLARKSIADRVGIQWHTAFQPTIGSSVEMFLFDDGYGGVVNLDNNVANIAIVTTPKLAMLADSEFGSFLSKTILTNPSALERLGSLDIAGRILTASPITPTKRQSQHGAAYLVGDARQTVEPFTGEGILFALQDAYLTAQKIIETYGKERLPRVDAFSRVAANKFISPALQHPLFAQKLLDLPLKRFASAFGRSILG